MDAASPNPIASTITKADEALITDWLEGSAPLTELCTRHNISLVALAIWSRRPDIVALMDSLREMHESRIKRQVALAATNAIETLHKIAATPEPSLAQEISRRAAASILRLDAKLTPRSRQPRDRRDQRDRRDERPTHSTPPTSLDGTTPVTPPAQPEANQPSHPTRAPAPSQQPARIPRHQPQLQPAAKLHPARPDSVSTPVSPSNLDSPTTPAASPPKPPSRGRRPPRN